MRRVFARKGTKDIGSISSTLNSIDRSLLNQINTDLSASQVASPGSVNASLASAAGTSSSDSANFSQFAHLFQQLQQLQTTNPADFKQVTASAASQLQAAAKQSTDPAQASFLSNLADKFQQASQSGNLSSFENGAQQTSGHH